MKKASKTEMKALYTAFDIHRRTATLAAMWTAFDPFGAIVYALRSLEWAAFALREAVKDTKDYWDYTKEPNHPLRPIKEGHDNYGTFKNHIKGIEGAIRRLLRNNWIVAEVGKNEDFTTALEDMREYMAELKSNF